MRDYDEEPPSCLCKSTTIRVHPSSSDRSIAWLRTMVNLQHLSNPCLASRLRNDNFILAPIGLFGKG